LKMRWNHHYLKSLKKTWSDENKKGKKKEDFFLI
jgi:hypothetical protein